MGYQKANLVANGQMQASPFVTIGTNGVFLSDLSVTGDPIESEGGCWANVSIAMLTGTGFNQYVGDMIKITSPSPCLPAPASTSMLAI